MNPSKLISRKLVIVLPSSNRILTVTTSLKKSWEDQYCRRYSEMAMRLDMDLL